MLARWCERAVAATLEGVWLIALLLFIAFLVWFAIEPRMVWPGFLLTFSLGAAAIQIVVWCAGLTAVPVFGVVFGVTLLATLFVIATMPVLVGLFLVVHFGIMLRREGPTATTFLSGAVGVGVLGYVVAVVVAVMAGWSMASVLLALLGLPLFLLAVGFVCFVVYSNFYVWWCNTHVRTPDAVVVLGGALRGGRTVSALVARRVDRGLEVARRCWEQGLEVPVVMSGGQGSDELVPEAQAMAEYADTQGAPPRLVLREERSTTTDENLRFTAELLRAQGITGPVVVATNDYHAFRAATMMRKAGLAGNAIGYATARYYWPAATIREYLAVLRDHRTFVGVVIVLVTVLLGLVVGMALLG